MNRLMFVVLVLVVSACGGDDADTTTAAPAPTTQAPVATTEAAPTTQGPVATTEAAPTPTSSSEVVDAGECAHVVDATIEADSSGFTISATVRSGDTGLDKYADLWEVRDEEGTLLGERVLAHPHETEQPFTRSVSGVAIPDNVAEVVIAARDPGSAVIPSPLRYLTHDLSGLVRGQVDRRLGPRDEWGAAGGSKRCCRCPVR